MDEKRYTKLSLLVNDTFTVEAVDEYLYKRWDAAQSKMLVSQEWQEGYRKLYPVTTDKGQLDMGSGQLGTLLEACFHKGKSDLIGKAFSVKSNGKMGLDIRYYFNVVKPKEVKVEFDNDFGPPISDMPEDFLKDSND